MANTVDIDPRMYRLPEEPNKPLPGEITNPEAPTMSVVANKMPEAPEDLNYEGLFGMKGGLRDIIGLLGDAFLIQAGKSPMYAPQRETERAANAMQGFFNGNEDEQEMALQRLSTVDPYKAADIKKHLEQQDINKLYKQSLMDSRDRQNDIREDELRRKKLESYGKMTGLARAANEKTWPTIRNRLMQMAQLYGIDEEFPENYDPDWVNAFASGMSPYEAARIEQLEKDTDSKIANRRPPQPKNPARPVVVQNADGTYRYERPDRAVGQQAPAPRVESKPTKSKEPPVPVGFRKLPDGRWQNIETGQVFIPKMKG